MDGQMDRWTIWMEELTDRQTDRQIYGQTIKKLDKFSTIVQACHLIHTSCRSELSNYYLLFRNMRKGSVSHAFRERRGSSVPEYKLVI